MTVVGPSGCGKSTLLRSIAGLEEIDGGDIYIGDRKVNSLPPHKRNVAMVFQSYALYPNLSVFENIAFPLRAIRIPQAEIKQKVEGVATRLGLFHHLSRKPRQLSGGERQRVAIARAIVRNPSSFLMDEPLSNLDAELRRQMRTEIVRLQRQLGVTTLFVTHDQVEAITMSDRITVLKDGKIQQIGRPEEVYRRPANTFVAGFIGSPGMNLIKVSLVPVDGGGRMRLQGSRLDVPVGEAGGLKGEEEVIMGVRPEDFQITDEQDAMLAGRIDLAEYLGSETVLTLRSEAGEFTVKAGDRRSFRLNDMLHVKVPPRNICLYSPKTRDLRGTLHDLMTKSG
ncbi:trehalose import ATP-binding protein SugC [Peptococcaceae bacterium CEB3]|nr:trehalose import ATP-binding protein SugC [Peptococcaceae bacterium CEB3]